MVIRRPRLARLFLLALYPELSKECIYAWLLDWQHVHTFRVYMCQR